MSKHLELARKLKALADRGVGGEKETAESMLNALLKKHNITIEEIECEKIEEYYFNLTPGEHDLWHQIIKHVNYSIKCYGEFPKKLIKDAELGGNYMIKCTAANYVEIDAKYAFYKNLYNEELDVFYSAFLMANDLLVDNPNKKDDNSDISMEDYEQWKRRKDMAEKITVGQFRKQLSATCGKPNVMRCN